MGNAVSLSVGAGGSSLSYQWQKESSGTFSDLAGETGSSLNFSMPTFADNGSYRVIVVNNCGSITSSVAVLTVLLPGTVYYWDNSAGDQLFGTAANWNPDGNPNIQDLVVVSGANPACIINSNWGVDTLRLSDGGSVNQTNGLLTIVNGLSPDNGLWVGEFGPGAVSYTLNGGAIRIS